MQTRRRSLQLAGTALAGLAGCVSTLDGEGDGTDATDDGPTGDDGTATDRAPTDRFEDVALSDMLVREAVAYYRWPGSTAVLAPSDEQFVLASVSPQGDD
jgi:hypothetical protein